MNGMMKTDTLMVLLSKDREKLEYRDERFERVVLYTSRYSDYARLVVDDSYSYELDRRLIALETVEEVMTILERYSENLPFRVGDAIKNDEDAACLPDRAVLLDRHGKVQQVSDYMRDIGERRRFNSTDGDSCEWLEYPATVIYLYPEEK